MTGRFIKIMAAAAIAGVFVASCGGDDDSTSSLTKAQFIKQADAICKNVDQAQVKVLTKADEESPISQRSLAAQAKLIVELGLPPIEEGVEEIAALGAPEGDEEQIEALVSAYEAGLEGSQENPNGIEKEFARADKLATAYGLKECGEIL